MVKGLHRLCEAGNVARTFDLIGSSRDEQAGELHSPSRHAAGRRGARLALEIIGERAMAAQVNFRIDHAGQKVHSRQIDFPFAGRQEFILTHRHDLSLRHRDTARQSAAGRNDVAVFKNQIGDMVRHNYSAMWDG